MSSRDSLNGAIYNLDEAKEALGEAQAEAHMTDEELTENDTTYIQTLSLLAIGDALVAIAESLTEKKESQSPVK